MTLTDLPRLAARLRLFVAFPWTLNNNLFLPFHSAPTTPTPIDTLAGMHWEPGGSQSCRNITEGYSSACKTHMAVLIPRGTRRNIYR
jgi:hypothetical protein